ncbi:MAG: hypothetical protein AVDCRST_MAG68-1271, partial [uncultured Gemmatimonadetes bacterium]
EFAAGNTRSPPAGTVVEKPADAVRGGGLRVIPAANSFAPGAGTALSAATREPDCREPDSRIRKNQEDWAPPRRERM